MAKIINNGVFYIGNEHLVECAGGERELIKNKYGREVSPDYGQYRENGIAYGILRAHSSGGGAGMKIKFDALVSHDITYVSIIQTARVCGLKEFPVPYALTNCHNSLCAIGGTINEDDHMFGLSAAKKYGGIFVPAHLSVIHTWAREMMAGCGKMILGSDSHTRYGALGTLGVGEGGPELVKPLLGYPYEVASPEVIAVYLTGEPKPWVGPHDVALELIGAVYESGFVKNKVLEFIGPGVSALSAEFRNGVDVMTTETTCWSSVWRTDGEVKKYYEIHGRPGDYRELNPGGVTYYDGAVTIDLSAVRPMIALPFHPGNVYAIDDLNANLRDIVYIVEADAADLFKGKTKFSLADKIHSGRLFAEQGVIAGCAGGIYDNICAAANIFKISDQKTLPPAIQKMNINFTGRAISPDFSLSVYPASQPVALRLSKLGIMDAYMRAGATVRTAFCGPCFGAGDVPANNTLSVRHTTRNFPNREGSVPKDGQIASVALMDARSIAATAVNGGAITSAEGFGAMFDYEIPEYQFDRAPYDAKVYNGWGRPAPDVEIRLGPNITDWPKLPPLAESLLLLVASVIDDPVTTTDELIPSGETSSYRSNPLRLAQFTLSRRDPEYVGRAKSALESKEIYTPAIIKLKDNNLFNSGNLGFGSLIYANKPGDGSAREQAASCQRVLGGCANIAREYATKRYRSNVVNWGMLPFIYEGDGIPFKSGQFLYIPGIRADVENGVEDIQAYVVDGAGVTPVKLKLPALENEEKAVVLSGCLMNRFAELNK